MFARRARRAYVVPLAVCLLVASLLLVGAGPVLAQTASAAPLPTPFDPRGGGSGPGVVGAPFIAALAVVALGIAAAASTALYVRLARRH